MISILVPARKDSKFLAKFILGFVTHTKNFNNVELIIFTPEGDWNKELFEYFKDYITVVTDDTEIGRGGNYIHYKEAAKHANGEWLWYMCDDQFLFDGYDEYLTDFIKEKNINPEIPQVITPACKNLGRVTHIISRKMYELVGFGQHGNVDSYFNEMLEWVVANIGNDFMDKMPYIPSKVVMEDLGTDKNMMSHTNRDDFDPVAQVAYFKSKEMKDKIKQDAGKIIDYMKIQNLI